MRFVGTSGGAVDRGGGGRRIRSYAHRSNAFSQGRERLFERLYSLYGIPFREGFLSWNDLFGNERDVLVEIGSGMGEATVRFALENPDLNILAVEVYKPGVEALLHAAEAERLANLRICRADAMDVFEHMIPQESLSGIHLFFPDPWPKRRHRKRRLVQPRSIRLMASRLRAGAYFYAVTDSEDYAGHILRSLEGSAALKNVYDKFSPRMPWRPVTRYETMKLAGGRTARECFFVKDGHDLH